MVQKLLGNLLLLLEGLVNLFYYGNCLWLQRGREKGLKAFEVCFVLLCIN